MRTVRLLLLLAAFAPVVSCSGPEDRAARDGRARRFLEAAGELRRLGEHLEAFPLAATLDAVAARGREIRALVEQAGDDLAEDVEGFEAARAEAGTIVERGQALARNAGARLRPDLALSFSTACQTETLLCIMTDTWALHAAVPGPDATVKTGTVLVPLRAAFYRGRDLPKYVHPPGGPVTPPPPAGTVQKHPVEGLRILVRELHKDAEPEAYLVAVFSRFRAGGASFDASGPFRLVNKGPYP